jgi:hypothetical protein
LREDEVYDSRSYEELTELVDAQQLLIDQLSRRLAELDENVGDFGVTRGSTRTYSSDADDESALQRDPDETVTHAPAICSSCGEDLLGAKIVGTERWRVLEISEIHLTVTEHVLERRICTSGHETDGDAPGVGPRHLSYGPGVKSFAAYLSLHQHLPLDQTAQILSDLLGHDFAVSELAQLVSEVQGPLR